MKKSILNRINAINEMLPKVNQSDEIPSTYAGGTFPYYIELNAPIRVKNQFVYISEEKSQYGYGFDKRYNVNNEGSLEQLMYDLTQIKRAFTRTIKTL